MFNSTKYVSKLLINVRKIEKLFLRALTSLSYPWIKAQGVGFEPTTTTLNSVETLQTPHKIIS
jgi:hypothetical protein